MLKIFLSLGIVISISFSSSLSTFKIGTGSSTGTYYPTGKTICEFYNKIKTTDEKTCEFTQTTGSYYNITALSNNNLDFGIAQSDVIYQAIIGDGKFQGKKRTNIRSIMAIYPELLSLIVRKDSDIKTLEEIKGKRINLGNTGSGNETTVKNIFNEFSIKNSDLLLWNSALTENCPVILNTNQIDGYFYMVGHPAKNIIEAQKLTPIDLIPLEGKNAQNLLEKYPYYAAGYIPANTYKGIDKDVKSIGVKAVLVTTKDMDDKTIETIIKAILDNFEEFKNSNPAYKSITKKSLLEGLSAPLHVKAKGYYKELNLLP